MIDIYQLIGIVTIDTTTCRDWNEEIYCPDPDALSIGDGVEQQIIYDADGKAIEMITRIEQPSFTGISISVSHHRCIDPVLYPRIFSGPTYPSDHVLVAMVFAIVEAESQ